MPRRTDADTLTDILTIIEHTDDPTFGFARICALIAADGKLSADLAPAMADPEFMPIDVAPILLRERDRLWPVDARD